MENVMKPRKHYYVNRFNAFLWLTVVCMVCSAVIRLASLGLSSAGTAPGSWDQILLPVAAALLYALIAGLDGTERFYKTAIPVWMLAVYFAIVLALHSSLPLWGRCLGFGVLLVWMVLYTVVTAGGGMLLFLLPFHLGMLAAALLLKLTSVEPDIRVADILVLAGLLTVLPAVHRHPAGEYHPTWGDRTDGRRLRSLPPMAQVSPYIMVTRNTSTNYFTEAFEVSAIERYIRRKRRQGLSGFGMTHVFLACYVRALARYPGLNRFLAGQRVYSRGEDIQFCMVIKKEMSASSPDTVIKAHLSPYDTADDVYAKVNALVEKVKATPLNSNFDNTAGILTMIPGVGLKFVVWLIRTLDYFGLVPPFLLEISPFHGSVFFTSMGSLGIPPIYHHLYDFGNLPVFGAFGCKRRTLEVQEDGSVVQRKYVDFKFCMDERIVDGYYYAAFFKCFRRLIQHPELLDQPPEEVLADID